MIQPSKMPSLSARNLYTTQTTKTCTLKEALLQPSPKQLPRHQIACLRSRIHQQKNQLSMIPMKIKNGNTLFLPILAKLQRRLLQLSLSRSQSQSDAGRLHRTLTTEAMILTRWYLRRQLNLL
jgi:hypothetical protein